MAFSKIEQPCQQFDQTFDIKNISLSRRDTVSTLIIKINTKLKEEQHYDVVELLCEKAPLFKFLERNGSEKLDVGLLLSWSKDDKCKLSEPLRERLACGSLLVKKIFTNNHSEDKNFGSAYKAVFENNNKLRWLFQSDVIRPVNFKSRRPMNHSDLQTFWNAIIKEY